MHVISGGSGTWKTSLLFTMLRDFEKGCPVLGFSSHPCPWAYVAFDRDLNETWDTLWSVGYEPADVQLHSIYDNFNFSASAAGITQAMPQLLPHGGLLCVDGLQIICPDGNNYNAVASFTRLIRKHAAKNNITVVGLCHNAKSRPGEEYAHPRDKIMGSVAWGATVGTVLALENKTDSDKTLWVCPRTAREYSVLISRDESGRVFIRDEDDDTMTCLTLNAKLLEIDDGAQLKRGDIIAWGLDAGLSEATVDRWITKQAGKNGKLQRIGRGVYAKPHKN